jgi:heat-inducible transcriptional repressor
MTRQDEILKLIVEEFISTAEPVGSKTLIEKYHLPFSSATVRNDMADLEEKGYIEKTHASSGRVPSSKGYRYYVSRLREDRDLHIDAEFKKEFQMVLSKKSQSFEDVMNKSCKILSEMTNLATVVLGPDADQEHLISLQGVPISPSALTAIFITDKGYVENKTFVIRSEQDGQNIAKCIEFLNKRLSGTAISELSEKIESLKPILSEVLGHSSEVVMEALVEAFVKFAKDRIYATGSSKLLNVPEYGENKEKLKNVLDLLNDPTKLRQAVNSGEGVEDGSVNFANSDQDDVAILSEDFDIESMPGMKVAVVGPQRMDYKKLIGTLQYMAREIDKYFGEGQKNQDEKKEPESSKGVAPKGKKEIPIE